MNILICDDDKLYVDMIRKYVDEFFADHKITDYKVYEYNSGDEAAKNNEKIDIAFLDVEMDGINGIEAGKCLRNNNKNIVLFIITSYMGYLDDAMDEGVFRYINKPLERPVIMRGLHKALLLCSKSQSKKINIEYKGDNVIIDFADRMPSENWLIIDDNRKKSVVHTTDGQMYIRYFTDYDMSVLAKTEDVNDEYTDMWKIFFETIAIKQRYNPECQRNLMPVWMRKHVTEFQ